MVELVPLGLSLFYLIPFMAAAARNHDATVPILLVNLLLGWTVVAWFGLLAVALLTPAQSHPAARRRTSEEIGHRSRKAMPRILHETFSGEVAGE